MIDNFALGLTHALMALAAWRLMRRSDLDYEDSDPQPAHAQSAHAQPAHTLAAHAQAAGAKPEDRRA